MYHTFGDDSLMWSQVFWLQEESQKQLTHFLQETLTTMALCQAPLDSLKAAFQDIG